MVTSVSATTTSRSFSMTWESEPNCYEILRYMVRWDNHYHHACDKSYQFEGIDMCSPIRVEVTPEDENGLSVGETVEVDVLNTDTGKSIV